MDNGITIKSKTLTDDDFEKLSAEFERDWADGEIDFRVTEYGKTLDALQSLSIPVGTIEALERRARHENVPFPRFVRMAITNQLAR